MSEFPNGLTQGPFGDYMKKLSIIVPSRNEVFLQKTINDLTEKAEEDIEIIVVLDGYWIELEENPNVVIIHRGKAKGLRNAVNSAVAIAKGEYIMKIDAHCMFDKGYDVKLKADCEDNWICIPTRKRLDAENWCPSTDTGDKRSDINHMYISYPDNDQDWGGKGLNGKLWQEKNRGKQEKIHDLMTFQGSCWFMKKNYFAELEGLDEKNYGSFFKEPQELTFKCWLSGGRVIRNQNTWYAHLHKGKKHGRGYFLDMKEINKSAKHNNKWLNYKEAWDKQTKPLSWLIEKFAPVPGWNNEK